MGDSRDTNIGTERPAPVPWRHSLIFRVVFLCGVLFVCLLGSVFVLTRYYFHEAVREMEEKTREIGDSVFVLLEENPNIDEISLTNQLMESHEGIEVNIQAYAGSADSSTVHLETNDSGEMTPVGLVPLDLQARRVVLSLRATSVTHVAVLRAFRNRYMIALTTVFMVALGLMIYIIAKALRPLTELSESCAAISSGSLRTVKTRKAVGEVLALEMTFNNMVGALREKEQMEAKLRQAQRLSALGNLAAGVAHDVRNPLNAIKLLSSHALDMLGDDQAPAAKPLATIRTEVDRLEDIVSSFLSLAKERELSLEPNRADALLEECARLFRQDAEARGIRLITELRAGDSQLMLDARQWTRAILNVLLNAMEACPRGGRVRMFSRISDQACQIEIRDDGPGMSKEAAERVFDPYYTTKPGGTGLGLSITRGIVEEHGGAIELSSSEGQGCQVLITLPLDKAKAP